MEDELSACVFENGVGDFCDGESEVLNSVVCVPWIYHLIVDCSIDIYGYVVFGYDVLCGGRGT